ncbi:MAG: type II toxin-antitoxin system VapC family toxin [Anaerolineales bacterium]
MGLVLDTNVLIRAERGVGTEGKMLDFTPWADEGNAYISTITASELLVGVHRAESKARRLKRSAFVESILAAIPVLDFTLETARVHAEIKAALYVLGQTLGANDLIIAATALSSGHAVLTTDVDDFVRVPGLRVIPFELP